MQVSEETVVTSIKFILNRQEIEEAVRLYMRNVAPDKIPRGFHISDVEFDTDGTYDTMSSAVVTVKKEDRG